MGWGDALDMVIYVQRREVSTTIFGSYVGIVVCTYRHRSRADDT